MSVDASVANRARRNTISDAFRRSAVRNGTQPALRFADRAWSYGELDRAVDRVAGKLLSLGLAPGARVGGYGRNSDAYFILWLACTRAGLTHVPINYALTESELGYIVTQSGASVLVYDKALEAVAGQMRGRAALKFLGTFADGGDIDVLATATGGDGDPVEVEQGDEDLVQITYTSGTTAMPKGAMMTHRAQLAEYASCIVDLELSREDRWLAALPLYHTAQTHCFTMPAMLLGASTVLIEQPTPDVVLKLIEEHKVTSFFAPPTVWISLLRHPDFDTRDLSSVRNLYYGASIMPVPVLQELRQRLPGVRVFNCYGQSEIGPLATVLRPEEHDARPSSAGRPVLNVETRVVDEDMNDVEPGEQGEIVHRSPQLLLGYWDKPEETEEAFAGGWFHSGDIGVRDEEGYLYVVDRVKDIIKTGGTMVASREVEEVLFTHPSVSEVAVIALPDPKWIEAVTAVVVLRAGHSGDEGALIQHARQSLAPFKVPKRVIFVDNLPRNTAGKLLKRELRATYAG
ncbi:acyl-CoA synthetase [Chelatococcus reniformis]|uniref:3-methylmercaptopropionyl-CoA ligase n=1 Tax=Chelatococcus reniformis TaxID=1494448 RepID=A0A916U4B6_9HYPH|nr:acyl-CoA synthetase [Chelatococcus reniformis]GGC57029.1 acyl-CoA synthetase [Chelatococcus reniformis]